jgi:hypothetical protein
VYHNDTPYPRHSFAFLSEKPRKDGLNIKLSLLQFLDYLYFYYQNTNFSLDFDNKGGAEAPRHEQLFCLLLACCLLGKKITELISLRIEPD